MFIFIIIRIRLYFYWLGGRMNMAALTKQTIDSALKEYIDLIKLK
jgi:hypothetical protein